MSKSEAWEAALKTLFVQYKASNPYLQEEALRAAKEGWHSTAYNYAVQAGVPAYHLRSVYTLIFE